MASKQARAESVRAAINELWEQIQAKSDAILAEAAEAKAKADTLGGEYRRLKEAGADTAQINAIVRKIKNLDAMAASKQETVEQSYAKLDALLLDLAAMLETCFDREWYREILKYISVRKTRKIRGSSDVEDYDRVRRTVEKISEKLKSFIESMGASETYYAAREARREQIHAETMRQYNEDAAKRAASVEAELDARFGVGTPATVETPVAAPVAAPVEAPAQNPNN